MFLKRNVLNEMSVCITGVLFIYLFINFLQANRMYMVLKCEIAFIFRVESMNSSTGSYKNHAFNPYFSTNESGISEIEDITYMPVIKTLVEKNFKTHSKFYVNFLTFSLSRSLYDIFLCQSVVSVFQNTKKSFSKKKVPEKSVIS